MGQPWCKQPQAHHPRQLQRSATSQARMSTFIEATTIAQTVMPRLPLDGGSRVNINLHNYTKERPTEASQSSPTTTHKFLVTYRGHQGSSSRHSHDYLWKGDQESHLAYPAFAYVDELHFACSPSVFEEALCRGRIDVDVSYESRASSINRHGIGRCNCL